MIGALNNLLYEVSKTRRDDLEERENRFRDFANAASDWFWEMDENLRFSYFSDRFTDVTDVPQESLLGRTRQESGIPNVDEAVWQAHLADLAAHRPFRNFIHPRTRSDGEVVWLAINGVPVFDDEGGFKGYRGVGRDITEGRRMEDALRTAKEAAEAASRTKSEFLAIMSHELRTPLNAIIGFSEIMEHELFGALGDPRYEGYAKDIRQSGQHLLSLINDILDLSKVEAGRMEIYEEVFEMAPMVDSVRSIMSGRAEAAGLRLVSHVAEGVPDLRADRRMVRQVLLNVLSNAVKFTPAGGRVTVDVGTDDGNGIVVKVTDTGIGMDEKGIIIALTTFGQVEGPLSRKTEGTGLGLPLSLSLVELHGGSIEIESEPGVGTTVTVRFPGQRSVPNPSEPPKIRLVRSAGK